MHLYAMWDELGISEWKSKNGWMTDNVFLKLPFSGKGQ